MYHLQWTKKKVDYSVTGLLIIPLLQFMLSGNLNFLAHNKRSNKLRRIRLNKEEIKIDDDSSMDSDSEESLKSDIFEEDDNEKTNKTDMDEGKLVIKFLN